MRAIRPFHPSVLLVLAVAAWTQVAIPTGKGSYASAPPPEAGAAVDTFQRLSGLDVLPGETRPIPTNDWWSQVLVSPFAGDLWSQPLVAAPDARGIQWWYPREAADNGDGMKRGDPIRVSGTGFAPTRDLAVDWGDWHVVVREEEGDKHVDMTMVRGMPITWFEFAGLAPTLALPTGATVADGTGAPLGAATTTDRLLVQFGGRAVGVYLPAGTSVALQAGTISVTFPVGASWLSLAGLPDAASLAAWRAWAVVAPRSTKVSWQLTASSTMKAVYEVSGQDLTGGGAKEVYQTFPPHAWRDPISSPSWRSEPWLCPRGQLKGATGTAFSFEWSMPGIIPDFGIPEADPAGTATPWSKSVQDGLVDAYLAQATYGADTYWGGKDLVLMAKHAVFAARTGSPDAAPLLAKAEAALADWLSWTPGENAHYFAYYPRWKALIGFQSSYGSEQFTDNHFHYGYLVHAAALVGSLDPAFVQDWGPMLRMVARQYANWDRNATDLPFLRTFEPWTGHSYAGGTSSPTGNNQESTSEAMQSWIGLFLLGSELADTAMRDAGAFGYLMEGKATLEYWFDWKKTNFASGWAHTNVGIVFDGGIDYGTWFSGNPLHIHAIQWLPIAPGFEHLARDTAWARREYSTMQAEAAAANGYTDEQDYGSDWANVAFSFMQQYDPGEVCRRFQVDQAAGKGWTSEVDAGVTYAYAHAHRQLGTRAWEYAYGIPTVAGYRNASTGIVTHVAWNPSASEVDCPVYKSGALVGSIRLPPHAVVRHRMDAKLSRIAISSPVKTFPVGAATKLSVQGFDQYGASIDAGTVAWSSSSGTIAPDGSYTPAQAADTVRIAVAAGGFSATFVGRAGAAAKLSSLKIHPAYVQMLTTDSRSLQVVAKDQYGEAATLPALTWSARGGAVVDSTGLLRDPVVGTSWVRVQGGGFSDSIPVDAYAAYVDLLSGATATASSSLGANTAAKAIDGDGTTRWESQHGIDSSWLQVALAQDHGLVQAVVVWEDAAASQYRVQVSQDGVNWTDWTSVTGGDGGTDSLSGSGHGRYVRILGLKRTTAYGYSIFELRLRGFPRTAYSALLDADTADLAALAPRAIPAGMLRAVTIGGLTFRIPMEPSEQILSTRLTDLRGREAGAKAGRGTWILRVRTDRGVRSGNVVVP